MARRRPRTLLSTEHYAVCRAVEPASESRREIELMEEFAAQKPLPSIAGDRAQVPDLCPRTGGVHV